MRKWSLIQQRHVLIGSAVAGSLVFLVLLFVYNAVITSARPEPVPNAAITSPQQFAQAWEQFAAAWIRPLQDSAAALFWLVIGFVVLARLLSLLPVWNMGRSDKYLLRTALGLGLSFIVVASMALISLTPLWHLAALMGLAGSVLLAAYTARRMALRIEVISDTGQADAGGTAELAAFVAELGNDSPKGRWLPQASDATGFQQSDIIGLPPNAFLAAALGLIQSVAGTAPWRVVVGAAKDGALGVEITRNRQGIQTVRVHRGLLAQSVQVDAASDGDADPASADVGTASDLYRLAAAAILIEVSKKYWGFDGLCGATDWRSVGLHFIATTDALNDKHRATTLLTCAVDDDPKNRLAVLALNWRRHRYATGADEIHRHATWLMGEYEEVRGQKEGYGALRNRIVLNYLTAVCTLRSIPGNEDAEQQAGMHAVRLLESLHDDASELANGMRHIVAVTMRRLIPEMTGPPPADMLSSGETKEIDWRPDEWMAHDWLERANRDADPHVKYALACYYAQLKAPQIEKSIGLLKDALLMPDLLKWAGRDPSLVPLHRNPEFARLVGKAPRTQWLEVEPFAGHKTKLAKIGIAHPTQLAAAESTPLVLMRPPAVALAAYLGVGALELTALVRAANFCVAVEAQGVDFGDFEFEVTSELLTWGITEIHQVSLMSPRRREVLAQEISKSIGSRCVAGPDSATVSAWLAKFYVDVDIL